MNRYLFWPIRVNRRKDNLGFFRYATFPIVKDGVQVWAWLICVGPIKITVGFES